MDDLIKNIIEKATASGLNVEATVIDGKGNINKYSSKKKKIVFEISGEDIEMSIENANPADLIMATNMLAEAISEALGMDVMEVYDKQKETYKYFAESKETHENAK